MNVRWFFWLFFVFILPRVSAHEVLVGEHVVPAKEEKYPYLCSLTLNQEASVFNEQENNCSGTLISPNQILTAAHCFGKGNNNTWGVEITCGGKRTGDIDKIALPLDPWWRNDLFPVAGHDYALVTLKKPLKQAPLMLAKKVEDYFENGSLKEGIQCQIAGFGLDENDEIGNLNIASPEGVVFHYQNETIIMRSATNAYLKTSADHGDSGGALICGKPGAVPRLLGVAVNFGFDLSKGEASRIQNVFSAPGFAEGSAF